VGRADQRLGVSNGQGIMGDRFKVAETHTYHVSEHERGTRGGRGGSGCESRPGITRGTAKTESVGGIAFPRRNQNSHFFRCWQGKSKEDKGERQGNDHGGRFGGVGRGRRGAILIKGGSSFFHKIQRFLTVTFALFANCVRFGLPAVPGREQWPASVGKSGGRKMRKRFF